MKFLYTITLSVLLLSCANTNQSIVKSDDELSSTITLLFDKYVANDFEIFLADSIGFDLNFIILNFLILFILLILFLSFCHQT